MVHQLSNRCMHIKCYSEYCCLELEEMGSLLIYHQPSFCYIFSLQLCLFLDGMFRLFRFISRSRFDDSGLESNGLNLFYAIYKQNNSNLMVRKSYVLVTCKTGR